MLMEMYTRETGYKTKHTEEDSMNTLMVPNTSEIGKRTDRMDTELKPGQTMLNMKERMKMARSTASVLSNGQTNQFILGNSLTIIFMAKVSTHGPMAGNTKESGETIKCTVKVLLYGQMAASISVNTLMTRSMATASSFGLMADATEVNGATANKTAREHTSQAQAKRSMANGNKERESGGLEEEKGNKNNEITDFLKNKNLIVG